MKIRPLITGVACAALLLLCRPVAADNVKTDFDHHVDFSQYHTYSWGKIDVSDQFDAQRIQRAVDKELQTKGWQEVPNGGQVTLVVKDRVQNQQQLETFYDGLGGGWGVGWRWGGWGWGPGGGFGETTTTVNNVPEGRMVVDMFDTQSKQLLWRGISQGEISNNPDKNRKMIYEDIGKMFSKFPPKK